MAYVLQPAHVSLDVRAYGQQRFEVLLGAPSEEDPQVRLGVQTRVAPVSAEVGGHGRTQHEMIGRHDNGTRTR
jgi:hypothetical protein